MLAKPVFKVSPTNWTHPKEMPMHTHTSIAQKRWNGPFLIVVLVRGFSNSNKTYWHINANQATKPKWLLNFSKVKICLCRTTTQLFDLFRAMPGHGAIRKRSHCWIRFTHSRCERMRLYSRHNGVLSFKSLFSSLVRTILFCRSRRACVGLFGVGFTWMFLSGVFKAEVTKHHTMPSKVFSLIHKSKSVNTL